MVLFLTQHEFAPSLRLADEGVKLRELVHIGTGKRDVAEVKNLLSQGFNVLWVDGQVVDKLVDGQTGREESGPACANDGVDLVVEGTALASLLCGIEDELH